MRALLIIVVLFAGCTSPAITDITKNDAGGLSDSELQNKIVGHWYGDAFISAPHDPPGYREEFEYRADGSCTKIKVVTAIDPRTNAFVTSRLPEAGTWGVAGGKFIEHWQGAFPLVQYPPHSTSARIIHIDRRRFTVQAEPFDNYVSFYRRLKLTQLSSR